MKREESWRESLEKLQEAGLYNICFRNAGVGFMFYEGERPIGDLWRKDLKVHKYYPSFEEALKGESARLSLTSPSTEDKREGDCVCGGNYPSLQNHTDKKCWTENVGVVTEAKKPPSGPLKSFSITGVENKE